MYLLRGATKNSTDNLLKIHTLKYLLGPAATERPIIIIDGLFFFCSLL